MVKRQAWWVWVWGLEEATCSMADKNKLMPPSEKHLKKLWMICIKQKIDKPKEMSAKHQEYLAKAAVNFPILCSLQNTFSDLWYLSISQVTKMHCLPLGKTITQSNTLSLPGKVF